MTVRSLRCVLCESVASADIERLDALLFMPDGRPRRAGPALRFLTEAGLSPGSATTVRQRINRHRRHRLTEAGLAGTPVEIVHPGGAVVRTNPTTPAWLRALEMASEVHERAVEKLAERLDDLDTKELLQAGRLVQKDTHVIAGAVARGRTLGERRALDAVMMLAAGLKPGEIEHDEE